MAEGDRGISISFPNSLERRQLRGDMMEMFKIMKGVDKISADEFVSRVDSDRTRGHSLRVNKMRVKTVVRQGTFTQTVVNAWNVSLER